MQNWIIEFENWDNFHADTKEEAIQQFRDQYGEGATILKIMKDG